MTLGEHRDPAQLLAQLEAVYRQAPVGLAILDRECRYVRINECLAEMNGLPVEAHIGRTVRELLPVAADAAEAWVRQVFETGEPLRDRTFAAEVEPGVFRHFVEQWFPIRDARGVIVGINVAVEEITERVQLEEQLRRNLEIQRFLLALSDELREIDDPEQIQHRAATRLGERLGASRVGYAEIDPDGVHSLVTHNYTDGVRGMEGRYLVSDYSPSLLPSLRRGIAVTRDDVANDPHLTDKEKGAHALIEVGASVDLPLIRYGQLRAVLFMHRREPHAWRADELQLMSAVAERTWDAVERARAESAMRESDMRYRSLFASMEQGFCVIEALLERTGGEHSIAQRCHDYLFLETNPAFESQTGLTNAVGRTMRELAPNHERHWFETFGRVALTGEPARFEARAKALGRWYDVFAYRIGAAELHRVAVLFNDITGRKRDERERDQLLDAANEALADAEAARAEAEAANRSKSEFLAVMSHELRTPLNAIAGYTELMEMGIHGPISEEQRHALGRIQQSQRHLLGLINEVLNYARIDAGAVQYELTDVRALDAFTAAASLVRPQADARRLSIDIDEEHAGCVARADREKLQQVLLNLLGNAIKFTEPGGRIGMSCEDTDGRVRLFVRDTGIGIPESKLASIFDPFVQVDQRLTRRQEGVGLGLAISRDLARGMGGDLSVTSVDGDGSVFTVTLPSAGQPSAPDA